MTDAYRKRWIAVGVLWGAAVLLALWNLQTMERIGEDRQLWQVTAANQDFIDGRRQDMEGIADQVARLARPAVSPAMGRLAVQEELAQLAANCELTEFKASGESAPMGGETVPMTVSFKGTLVAADRWLAAVQSDFPYLVVRSMDAKGSVLEPAASFTVQLNCRFRAVSS